jgi:hypothetical protein
MEYGIAHASNVDTWKTAKRRTKCKAVQRPEFPGVIITILKSEGPICHAS